MFKTVAVGGHIVALLLQRILQHGVPRKALTLQFNFGIQQRFLHQQFGLLRGAQRIADGAAVEAVAHLQQLLRGRVHRVLDALGLGL